MKNTTHVLWKSHSGSWGAAIRSAPGCDRLEWASTGHPSERDARNACPALRNNGDGCEVHHVAGPETDLLDALVKQIQRKPAGTKP